MAAPQQISNYVPGITLAAPLTSGAGPIVATLTSVAGLPTIGNFVLRLDDPAPATTYEWVEVTAVNVGASQVTIGTRGMEGTTAIAHGIGTIVSNLLSAGMILRAFPWGILPGGYAAATAVQSGITSTLTDLTGLTVTVTVGAGRKIRITAQSLFAASNAGNGVVLSIAEGATQQNQGNGDCVSTGRAYTVVATAIISPTAGSHTYKLQAALGGGTGTISTNPAATYPSFILVEDIGPV